MQPTTLRAKVYNLQIIRNCLSASWDQKGCSHTSHKLYYNTNTTHIHYITSQITTLVHLCTSDILPYTLTPALHIHNSTRRFKFQIINISCTTKNVQVCVLFLTVVVHLYQGIHWIFKASLKYVKLGLVEIFLVRSSMR